MAIPRAYILTNITSKNPWLQVLVDGFRDGTLQFDGIIADALGAVDNFRLNDGTRWAGIYATRAGPAMIGRWCVRL